MGIWIGLGIFTLVILIIILWLLHKPVEIALFLVYSKSEKVATIRITGLFTIMKNPLFSLKASSSWTN